MAKYTCTICEYVYDEDEGCPEQGIAPGTPWDEVDEDLFQCPDCGMGKEFFDLVEYDELDEEE